jgi:hypothetical protein
MKCYFLLGVSERIELLGEGRVVGLQEFKGFGDAGHGGGGRTHDVFEFLEGCELSLEQSLDVRVDLLLEFLILHTLNDGRHTKSSSGFRSFFLASFLGAVYAILKFF